MNFKIVSQNNNMNNLMNTKMLDTRNNQKVNPTFNDLKRQLDTDFVNQTDDKSIENMMSQIKTMDNKVQDMTILYLIVKMFALTSVLEDDTHVYTEVATQNIQLTMSQT